MKALLAFAIGLVMLVSATIVTGDDLVQCVPYDEPEVCYAVDLTTGELVPIACPLLEPEPFELNPEDMIILNPEDMPPIQRPPWMFDDISLPGIPDMFIDMDDIFDHIDVPTWQPKKWPAPEWISSDELPDVWIGPWTEPVMLDPDCLGQEIVILS